MTSWRRNSALDCESRVWESGVCEIGEVLSWSIRADGSVVTQESKKAAVNTGYMAVGWSTGPSQGGTTADQHLNAEMYGKSAYEKDPQALNP